MAEYFYMQPMETIGNTDEPVILQHLRDMYLQPVRPLSWLCNYFGLTVGDNRLLGTNKIVFYTGSTHGGFDDALVRHPNIGMTDTFDLVRFIPPGLIYKGFAYMVECADSRCSPELKFDIIVSKASDGTIIQKMECISANTEAFAKGEMLDTPFMVSGGEALYVRIRFNNLPYNDESATGAGDATAQWWGDECNPVPCYGLRVHFLTEDTCLAPRLTGCGLDRGSCCPTTIPREKCEL